MYQKGCYPHSYKYVPQSRNNGQLTLPQIDVNGKIISIKENVLYANDEVIVDMSDNIFEMLSKDEIEEKMAVL